MNKVTEFTISRSKWLRGEGSDKSKLLRIPDSKECCLGFYLGACGIPANEMEDVEDPITLSDTYPHHIPPWTLDSGPSTVEELIVANDDMNLSETEREKRITEGFAKQGITVTFVD